MVDTDQAFLYLEKLDKFIISDSYSFYRFLIENRLTLNIVNSNFQELVKIVNHHNSPELEERLWNIANPTFRWKMQRKIIRALSNYLNSLFSTVDYSRNNIEKFIAKNQIILNEFNKKKNIQFSENPIHRFIQDLRNYTSHNTFIKIGSERSLNIEWDEPRRNVFVRKNELEWKQWNSFSKLFLNSQTDKIYLIDILKQHYEHFSSFQNWTYLMLFETDKTITTTFINEINQIFQDAKNVKMLHTLPFRQSYLKYILSLTYKAKTLYRGFENSKALACEGGQRKKIN